MRTGQQQLKDGLKKQTRPTTAGDLNTKVVLNLSHSPWVIESKKASETTLLIKSTL